MITSFNFIPSPPRPSPSPTRLCTVGLEHSRPSPTHPIEGLILVFCACACETLVNHWYMCLCLCVCVFVFFVFVYLCVCVFFLCVCVRMAVRWLTNCIWEPLTDPCSLLVETHARLLSNLTDVFFYFLCFNLSRNF